MQHRSMGEVISSLARQALQPAPATRRHRNGVPLLDVRQGATPVTLELVNKLRDEQLRDDQLRDELLGDELP